MSEFKSRRCPECGGTIRLLAKPGRTMRYKTMMLSVPESIAIPTCDRCGEEWFDKRTSDAVEAALSQKYDNSLRERCMRYVEHIREQIPIGTLEDALGITRGYFSRIQAEKKSPSAQLVGELALIAKNPKARLRELEDAWKDESTAA